MEAVETVCIGIAVRSENRFMKMTLLVGGNKWHTCDPWTYNTWFYQSFVVSAALDFHTVFCQFYTHYKSKPIPMCWITSSDYA